MNTTHNTKPATIAAAARAKERRLKVIEEIRCKVFARYCTCGSCESGNYIRLCMSYKGLARILNNENIASPRGKTGSWQVTMVKNLYKGYDGDGII